MTYTSWGRQVYPLYKQFIGKLKQEGQFKPRIISRQAPSKTKSKQCFIIIYLSFLNYDWLLIREVQWFYWTQELPGTSREIYSEDANGETRTRNPWITNPVL